MQAHINSNGKNRGCTALTSVDAIFITLLARYQYLTSDHFLSALYQPGSLTSVRARLKKLSDYGYFLPLKRRFGGGFAGSDSRCYTLSSRGRAVAKSLGLPVFPRFRPSEALELGDEVKPHLLAVNYALLATQRLCQETPHLSVGRVVVERELKHLCTAFTHQGKRFRAIPDGLVEIFESVAGQQFAHPLVFEVEMGSHYQTAWREKIARLVAWVESGTYERLFGRKAVTIAVLAVPGEQYAGVLKRHTEGELKALGRKDCASWFRFTGVHPRTCDPAKLFLEPHWQQPFSEARYPALALEVGHH